jgi:hypothetical protein
MKSRRASSYFPDAMESSLLALRSAWVPSGLPGPRESLRFDTSAWNARALRYSARAAVSLALTLARFNSDCGGLDFGTSSCFLSRSPAHLRQTGTPLSYSWVWAPHRTHLSINCQDVIRDGGVSKLPKGRARVCPSFQRARLSNILVAPRSKVLRARFARVAVNCFEQEKAYANWQAVQA